MAMQTLAAWTAEQRAGRVGTITVQWVRAPGDRYRGDQLLMDMIGRHAGWDLRHATLPVDAGPESQRHRHAEAAAMAETDPYILADDDCVPYLSRRFRIEGEPAESWTAYAARLLAEHPDLAMIAPLPAPGMLDPGTLRAWLARTLGEAEADRLIARLAIPDGDGHLWPVTMVGGIRVVRFGAVPADVRYLPPVEPARGGGYDVTLGQWLAGRAGPDGPPRAAYLTRLGCVHLGFEASVIWDGATVADPGLEE